MQKHRKRMHTQNAPTHRPDRGNCASSSARRARRRPETSGSRSSRQIPLRAWCSWQPCHLQTRSIRRSSRQACSRPNFGRCPGRTLRSGSLEIVVYKKGSSPRYPSLELHGVLVPFAYAKASHCWGTCSLLFTHCRLSEAQGECSSGCRRSTSSDTGIRVPLCEARARGDCPCLPTSRCRRPESL